ncbi:MAG: hypothetical protein ACI8PB_003170 [Desulforhopalus sp.]|jgi:hypothetical protein
MVSFAFRTPRIETNIPVFLRLQENDTGHLHPGSVSATIVNISKNGAYLLIQKLFINGKHLFFATLNNTHVMILQSGENTGKIKNFNISAQSVWMDSYKHDNRLCFKVGICFTTPQKKLFQNVKDVSA